MAAMLTTLDHPVPDVELDRMEQQRTALAETGRRLYPDVLPCLETLRAEGMHPALLSKTDGWLQRRRLQVLGLVKLLDVIALSGETGVASPDPAANTQGTLAAGNPRALPIDRTGRHPVPAGEPCIADLCDGLTS
ncbi:hypothetical protein MXD59_24870 [Frankia sp. Ag45/Mut15]|uniref:Uncharacterized protein n=1 Tax=Frankia umida TaxID=573489 RepID=A0ABT0K565_9ACTN|nr:hypothetical protein [Frankia umida]MCK9878951.1 hypothetical protein [Frankia umida]